MSLLSQASLVVVPSGYKEDVVYSVKPTDGSGDLTFTRASDGTRVNSQGYIERVPWNLLQYSEQFSSGFWTKTNVTLTSGQSGYDGTNDAWKIEANTASTTVISQAASISGVMTASIYAKAGTANWFRFSLNDSGVNTRAWFDLTNGVVGNVAGNMISTDIQNVGNGWYRCSITFNVTAANLLLFLADGNGTISPDAGDYIYIQDAQLNEGSTAKPYFPTTDRQNVPRLDYSNGCPSLLLEPQRTNYFEYSEDYSQIDWSKISLTVVSNAATSPDGYQNADKIYPSATGGISYLYNISSTSSSVHTISAYVKADGKNIVWLYIEGGATYGTVYFDLSDQSIQVVGGSVSTPSGTITAVGSDWYRITFTTGSALAVTSGSGIGISNAKGNTYVTASGTNGVLVWGAQLEAGSYATSYIPTTSASVTRVADAASKTGISSLIGQTEGTMFVEFEIDQVSSENRQILQLSDGSSNNLHFRIRSSNELQAYGTGNFAPFDKRLAITTGGTYKMALGYFNGDFAYYVNGVQIATDTQTTTASNLSEFYVGINNLTTTPLGGEIAQAVLFKTRLTNAELAALTTL